MKATVYCGCKRRDLLSMDPWRHLRGRWRQGVLDKDGERFWGRADRGPTA